MDFCVDWTLENKSYIFYTILMPSIINAIFTIILMKRKKLFEFIALFLFKILIYYNSNGFDLYDHGYYNYIVYWFFYIISVLVLSLINILISIKRQYLSFIVILFISGILLIY